MKNKNNAGFSLVEVLVAIVLLGTLVVPICSSLVLTFRMNEKTDTLLQAQLDVSSAVETLMAEGIDEGILGTSVRNFNANTFLTPIPYDDESGRFDAVSVDVLLIPTEFDAGKSDCYTVRVESNTDSSVFVETTIRENGKGAAA